MLVATKGGHVRPGDGSWTVDGSPAHLREAAEASLKALGVDAIGLYQFHRPDPAVPYEESIGALKDLLDAGKIRLAGISNATIAQIDTARRILGDGNLASVQNQFSPAFRSSEDELRHCATHGLAFLPWSPLGGIGRAGDLGTEHSAFGRSPTRTASRRSRSRWPGCWPSRRSWCPSRGPAGPRPSPTRRRPPTWSCPTRRCSGSAPPEPPQPAGSDTMKQVWTR